MSKKIKALFGILAVLLAFCNVTALAEDAVAGCLDKLLLIHNMEVKEKDGKEYYPVHAYTGIDSLDYKEVGFKMRATNSTTDKSQEASTKVVYTSMRVTDHDGNVTVYDASILGGVYMFGHEMLFNKDLWKNEDTTLYVTPYAITKDGKEIVGKTTTISDAIIKGVKPDSALFREIADTEEGTDGDVIASGSTDVTVNGNVTETDSAIFADGASAEIPAGVTVEDGTTELVLSVATMSQSKSDVAVGENEEMASYDVKVAGVAKDNNVPIIVTVDAMTVNGLNDGNIAVYHVEADGTKAMTKVASIDEVDEHNTYYYNPVDGTVTLALANFSEVSVVAETDRAWEGNFDYNWYDADATELTIANADQLAGLSAIVGGMNGKEPDTFKGKTVKLVSDINLADGDVELKPETNNKVEKIFYPIGYYYTDDKNADGTTGDYYSTVNSFEGTFNGNGHTIANFYQNTWEIKGDYDGNYYKDAMGLFGKVYGGTVKNLTVKNFSSDGEFTTTGVIAAYADGATFENIAIFDCNPRVYNIGNGGIVGCVGWYAKKADLKTTFNNITVDNSNKISALWGSWDVACGGLVGQYYPTSGQTSAGTPKNAGIHMENCHVSAQIDVYNDVCANYQYYAYRYAGMLIGSVRENETIDGHVYPKMDGITAKDCTVHFGTWNDYYYCELVDNTLASYTHDHQFSRLTEIKAIDGTTITYLDDTTGTVPASGRANYVIVDYTKGHGTKNATCYHFKDGEVWNHKDAGTEIVNGVEVLKEDNQHIYLEFNNLITGYGWGVTSKAIKDFEGIEILDIKEGNQEESVVKFNGIADDKYETETTVKIGDLFESAGSSVAIMPANIQVAVSPVGNDSTAGGTYKANADDWTQGTLTFTGVGAATITIQDYYFCTPTTITVEITDRVAVEKFETKFTGDFLYRVGNQNAVALGSLFKAIEGAVIDSSKVNVSVEDVVNGGEYTALSVEGNTSDWTKETVKFGNTGVIKVTITDNDCCTPTELILEVVDAVNATGAESATANNVVLLNDCGLGSLAVSGDYTFYGNGFTLTYTDNGRYLGKGSGFPFGVVNVTGGGTLDNARIKCSIYPIAALFSDQIANYYEEDGTKKRYYYQLSAVAVSGNGSKISNCYVYGGRNNIYVGQGNVTIEDSVLECGTLANMQIVSSVDSIVTIDNVTTIQYQTNPTTYANDSLKKNVMLGFGVVVGEGETTDVNPKIVLNGNFKQYNWVTSADADAVSDDYAKEAIGAALGKAAYKHKIDEKDSVNMGIVFLNRESAVVESDVERPYVLGNMTIKTVQGQVYSLQNAGESQIYYDYETADRTTVNGIYVPQFKYADEFGGQYKEKTDDGDEFFYNEGKALKLMFPSGETKEIDLSEVVSVEKYGGQNLPVEITCKKENGEVVKVEGGKVTFTDEGTYIITYTVTDSLFVDKNGEKINLGEIKYSKDYTLDVSLKVTSIPNARYVFDSSVQKIFRTSGNSNIVQFIPFLSGLKIYDYDSSGNEYIRFDGGDTSETKDYNKIARASIDNKVTTGEGQGYHIVTIELVDGGKLVIDMDVRANSGSSTHSGSIKVNKNVIYVVNGGTTSGKGQTWKIYSYKFVGNNGTEINSGLVTFGTAGKDCDTATKPSSNFSTTVKYTVTYDANGGKCVQSIGYATSSSAAVKLPTPSRSSDYVFAGWYTAANGGTKVGGAGDSYTPSANITLYAQWGKKGTVTYDANGGTVSPTSEKYEGTTLTLPTPTRDGHWFIGWYDAASGGNKIGDAGASYNPSNGDITLYAHWQEAIEYTVTYNANSGSCSTASATYQGTALTLPTPTRTGYTFNGWYDATSGGEKIGDAGASYTPSAHITLYAQWKINSYTIKVTTKNATVKVNGTTVSNNGTVSIQYGAQVTVEVTYSQSNSRSTTIKGTDGATYTSPFNMPAQDVTINATSSGSCVTADTLISLADGSQKRIDSLLPGEMLKVWDFENGTYTESPIAVIRNHGCEENTVITLTFSDGTETKTVNTHGYYDADLRKFVDINEETAYDYIGHEFVMESDDGYRTVTLTDADVIKENVEAWSLLTAHNYNFITDGVFSISSSIHGLEYFMPYEYDENLKIDAEKKQADIEKYGLYTYEDFADILTEEQFDALNMPQIKVSVGKGLITWEELLEVIEVEVNSPFFPAE